MNIENVWGNVELAEASYANLKNLEKHLTTSG